MFKELLNLFGPNAPFQEIHSRFMEALEAATEVFRFGHAAAWSGEHSDERAREIKDLDIRVNQIERDVRKRIVRHLSLQQGLDIIYCLRFMSLVKDVERIGDYGKNLYDIAEIREGDFDQGELQDRLSALAERTAAFLSETAVLFRESAEGPAGEALDRGRVLMHECEQLVTDAARSDLSVNTAVCFALMARHYKRITGHATNVLSGLTMPIHKLDYFDESS